MALAKVIPIVNGLVYTILADAPNPFVQVMFWRASKHSSMISVTGIKQLACECCAISSTVTQSVD